MDSDDNFTSLSPPSPLLHRRLKRLKKSAPVPQPPLPAESTDEIYSEPGRIFDSSDSQTLESLDAVDELEGEGERKETKRALDFDDVEGEIDLDLNLEGSEKTKEMEFGEIDGDLNVEGSEKTEKLDGEEKNISNKNKKKKMDFGDVDGEFDVGLNVGGSEKKTGKVDGEEGFSDNNNKEKNNNDHNNNKKKKKRSRSGGDDDGKAKSSVSNRRREEKERKIYLQQLHAESQKLLRETRDATFKPIPVVHKPISSVLEKIRQRKLELMKKTGGQNNNCSFPEKNTSFRGVMVDDDSENVSREREADQSEKVLQEKTVPCENNSNYSLENNGVEEALAQSEDDDSHSRMAFDEPTIQPFRAPVDDTQDLFTESETSEGKEDVFGEENSSPLEEKFTPSLLAMNLKFDSAPPDDSSSDEEDSDKENVLPKGDPVKAFIDEEAEEEDDSDHDIRFQENEEENYENYEELKDLIATGNEENRIDKDMRNELHQKWLEQQDATGTDNLMQRLKYGVKLKEKILFEDEQEDLTDDEEFCDNAAEYPLKSSVARKNKKKAKLMIPQLFSDKNDGYLSSDEEEMEKRLTKQRVLDKVEKQSMLVPPAEDENSREVFGLIKKLNIVPDTKKNAKPSITGANTNVFSKSSFVGRKGNHSVPSSHRQGTSTVRSFIFGRDDSNSRSSLSISEDSSDVIIEETPPTRNVTTKLSSSQFKFSSQITKTTTNTATGPSLFEYLKRSSIKSDNGKQESTVGLTQTVYAAFKIPKKPLKIERRF